MPSSTSSSSRAPAGRWGLTWLVTCAIAIATLGSWESFWRSRGFRPAVADSLHLWSLARTRVADGGPSTVVLIGSSNMQVAVDLDLLSRETHGLEPVQLAMTGSSPLPVLDDLAQDPSFRGIVVSEHVGTSLSLVTNTAERLPQIAIDFHRRASVSFFQAAERDLRLFVLQRAVFRSSLLAPDRMVRALETRRWPSPGQQIMGADRALTLAYNDRRPQVAPGVITNLRREAAGKDPPRTEEALQANLHRIAVAVEAIRRRGGAVVFVRFACQGPYRIRTQPRYSANWDLVEARTDAVLLDLDQEPYATELRCPDGTHLDEDSQKRFTRILAGTLNERVLPGRR